MENIEKVEDKLNSFNFGSIKTDIELAISSEDFYIQSLTFLISVSIAFLITIIIRKIIREKFGEKQFRQFLRAKIYPLLTPILSLIVISLGYSIISDNIENRTYIDYYNKLIILLLFIRMIKITVNSLVIKAVLISILVPSGLLYVFGFLENFTQYLDDFGFTAGEVRISALTLVKGVIAITIVLWLGRLINNIFADFLRKQRSINYSTRKLLMNVFNIILYFILTVIGLNFLGIDLTAITVFGGALGVGLGFGLQKIASNFISGIILLMERSIKQNDLIELEDGTLGWVRDLGARATRIETYDGQEIMIPNEEFITKRTTNWTYSNTQGRVTVEIGVSYNSDMGLVRDLIMEAAKENPKILDNPAPKVHMREYGNSSVNFFLLYWIADITEERWGSMSEVLFSVWDKFKDHDIEIPFPQRDLHVRSVNEEIYERFGAKSLKSKKSTKPDSKSKPKSKSSSSASKSDS
jgi:small-conductance mechanosensitive channel